ncbi:MULTISPECIES: hypothetical protein, partial [unclassified Nocardiopsis]
LAHLAALDWVPHRTFAAGTRPARPARLSAPARSDQLADRAQDPAEQERIRLARAAARNLRGRTR